MLESRGVVTGEATRLHMQHELFFAEDGTGEEGERFATLRFRGQLSLAGGIAATYGLLDSSEWRAGLRILVDLDDAQISGLSLQDIRALADLSTSLVDRIGPSRIAVVAESAINFGVSRMWEALTSERTSMDVCVFRETDSALGWLGIKSVEPHSEI